MKITLEQCSRCHREMEADDLAWDVDEDFPIATFDPEMIDWMETRKYHKLCFACLKKVKQETLDDCVEKGVEEQDWLKEKS